MLTTVGRLRPRAPSGASQVLWLDIEHTDGKRYFTWDALKFPTPLAMQADLKRTGRNMVTIIDPHLKADDGYAVFATAKKMDLLVRKDDDSGHFEGDCWPGRSGWIDYLLPQAREYWAGRFTADNYVGSSASLYTWNDMNEPSVERGPEVTMPMTLIHRTGDGRQVEHRELHNMYGMLQHAATFEGQQTAYPQRRPFVLTRAFFSGSQRTAAVWTGDNKASWAHLAASTPMLLALSLSGIPFVGADVGGFFGNPTTPLLVRWYQAAVFHPFFRAHAEFKTKRREPYLFGDEVTRQVKTALSLRYSLLPYLYTLFAQHAKDGSLVMRPMWYEFPHDPSIRGNAWWSVAAEAKAERAAAEAKAAEAKAAEEAAKAAEEAAKAAEAAVAAAAKAAEEAKVAAEAKAAEEAAAEEARRLSEQTGGAEDAGGVEEGPCPCFKCDDAPCWHPACEKCGTKENAGCAEHPTWGCYTSAEAECTCNANPNPEPEPDPYDEPNKPDDELDEASADKGFVDEYYHGEVREGGGEQDEDEDQTGEQFLLGPHLLVQPITTIKPLSETRVYLPASDPSAPATWYDLHTSAALTSTAGARVVTVGVHADRVPAFLRGGAVLPTRERLRRSSQGTHTDPFTLTVAPDGATGRADGSLYLDAYDGYEQSSLTAHFAFEPAHGLSVRAVLSGTIEDVGVAGAPPAATSEIERVVVLGQAAASGVVVHRDGVLVPGVSALFDAAAGTITVRKPQVKVGERWTIGLLAAE